MRQAELATKQLQQQQTKAAARAAKLEEVVEQTQRGVSSSSEGDSSSTSESQTDSDNGPEVRYYNSGVQGGLALPRMGGAGMCAGSSDGRYTVDVHNSYL